MKIVLSGAVVSEELGYKGIPAPFLVCSLQQFTGFLVLVFVVLSSNLYKPKRIAGKSEWFAVCCFSVTFAMNVGFNLFSLSMVPMSIHMVIRSCLPLPTAISQLLINRCSGNTAYFIPRQEVFLMCGGVVCAVVATLAKAQGSGSSESSWSLILGVTMCCFSLFTGALNMALAGLLGTKVKLNPFDTTFYMALPVMVCMSLPIMFAPHPTWKGTTMTDWQVLLKVLELSPSSIGLVLFSGVLSLSYNVLQIGMVQQLSATHTTLAGNFNKAAIAAVSLLIGLETLPSGQSGAIWVLATMGNIALFTIHSLQKGK